MCCWSLATWQAFPGALQRPDFLCAAGRAKAPAARGGGQHPRRLGELEHLEERKGCDWVGMLGKELRSVICTFHQIEFFVCKPDGISAEPAKKGIGASENVYLSHNRYMQIQIWPELAI